MKQTLFIFFLIISQKAISQGDLAGYWHLNHVSYNNELFYNIVPNNLFGNISFDSDTEITGSDCNPYTGFGGAYNIINGNTISITDMVWLASSCQGLPALNYGGHYKTILSNNLNYPSQLNYLITGSGNNETLKLTNSNGDFALYSKTPLPYNDLPGLWYLHKITENGVDYINTHSPTININITTSTQSIIGFVEASSVGICNTYLVLYYLLSPSQLSIAGTNNSNNTCSSTEEDLYEERYTNVMTFDVNVYNFDTLDYVITGSGNNAILKFTNANNDDLYFGRQALSNEDFISLNDLKVFPNPVEETLNINTKMRLDYSIYSIDGKQVKIGTLTENSNKILVNSLENGIYFLTIFKDEKKETLKFVKK